MTLACCEQPPAAFKDIAKDLAKCKLRAMELYRPSDDDLESSVSPTFRYIDACMVANGYKVVPTCAADTVRSDWGGCWKLW
jgi:hypothetical protein